MIIKFQAFKWGNDSIQLTTTDFLKSIKNGSYVSPNHRQVFITHDDSGFFAGIILTIKDQKKFAVIQEQGGIIDLKVHEVGKNEKIADFNYFIFNPKKKLGMYQYYHASCTLLTFNKLIAAYYAMNLDEIRENALNKLKKQNKTENYIKSAIEKYSNTFNASIIENEDNFEAKMQELANILYFDCSFTELKYVGGTFSPITENVKNFSCRASFHREDANSTKLRNLLKVFREIKPSRAKITGLDENDNEVSYKLFADFENYATYNYDDMISSMSLNPSKIKRSILNNKIILELKNVFARNF